MSKVEFCTDSSAGIIVLNDGDNGNRLNPESLEQLEKAIDALETDEKVRIIFLRAAGKYFCLGMDLVKAAEGKDVAEVRSAVSSYSRILDRLHNSAKMTVALVNAPVKAGGVGLTSACDMVFCTENADFELSESIFGLLPANVLPYLYMMRISPQAARYLVLTAQKIDAEKALKIGLVDDLFPTAEFEKKVRKLAKQLVRISPESVKQYKNLSLSFLEQGFSERRETAIRILTDLLGRDEVLQTVRDFNDGITPAWFTGFKPKESVSGITEE